MGRVLGLHDGVTGEATELDRLHDLDTLVRRTGENDDVDRGGPQEDQQPAAGLGDVEVEYGQQRRALAAGRPAHLAAPEGSTR